MLKKIYVDKLINYLDLIPIVYFRFGLLPKHKRSDY